MHCGHLTVSATISPTRWIRQKRSNIVHWHTASRTLAAYRIFAGEDFRESARAANSRFVAHNAFNLSYSDLKAEARKSPRPRTALFGLVVNHLASIPVATAGLPVVVCYYILGTCRRLAVRCGEHRSAVIDIRIHWLSCFYSTWVRSHICEQLKYR